MSNGEEIVVRAAMKPLPTLMKPLRSVDLATGEPREALVERSRRRCGRGARGRRRGCGRVGARACGEGEVRRRLDRRLRRRPSPRTSSASHGMNALDRHLALIGFMGAGKTTLGRVGGAARPPSSISTQTDRRSAPGSIGEFFAHAARRVPRDRGGDGAPSFSSRAPAVLALGGGAVTTPRSATALVSGVHGARRRRRRHPWSARGASRPHAQDEAAFPARCTRSAAALPQRRRRGGEDADGVCSQRRASPRARRARTARRARARRRRRSPSSRPRTSRASTAPSADALGDRLPSEHELPAGRGREEAAVVERLWSELGSIAAAQSSRWAAVRYRRRRPRRRDVPPRRPVGRRADDARRPGRRRDRRQDRRSTSQRARTWSACSTGRRGRDRRGAARDAARARAARRASRSSSRRGCSPARGWTCAARRRTRRRSACVTRTTAAPRRWLNLGHTFAHALEAAADFDLPHGEAVALGLLAALRLSRPRHGAVDRRAGPAAGRGRPRARLAGAPARQEAHRRRRSTSSCSATMARVVERTVPADEVRAARAADRSPPR